MAYADFVTAMMAFFLLMWLINTTDPEQKRGIAEYFAPASVSATTSGSGGILGGTSLGDDGAKSEGAQAAITELAPEAPTDSAQEVGQSQNLAAASEEALRQEIGRREAAEFASAAESLRQAMQSMPELAELSKQLIIDQTPEGLRIQLVDQEGRSMFGENSAVPNERAKLLMRAVAKVITTLPNRVSITGHTSGVAGVGGQNPKDWALSTQRADAARVAYNVHFRGIACLVCRAPENTTAGGTGSHCLRAGPTGRRLQRRHLHQRHHPSHDRGVQRTVIR